MKHFLLHSIKILGIVIVAFFFLEFLYTYAYSKATQRNKIQNVINGESQKLDVVILGSSRANNHFVSSEFKKKGLRVFNYGMSGSRLEESALLLQLMIEKKYHIQNVIVEVDLNINSEGYSEGTRAMYMPYLTTSKVVSQYYSDLPDYSKLRYIPFYRYIVYDSKIGFREMFFSWMDKKTKFLQNDGYYPLDNQGINMQYDLSKYVPHRNKSYELIKKICAENAISLLAVTTPICQNVTNREYFKEVTALYPEVHNLENVVTEDQYFSSCGHMNHQGALRYTQKVIATFFNK